MDDIIRFDGRYLSLRDFLAAWLNDREIVVFYDISAGMSFPTDAAEASFRRAADLEQADLTPEQEAELSRLKVDPPEVPLPREPGKALELLGRVGASLCSLGDARKRIAIIIEHAETVVPDGDTGSLNPEDRTNIVSLRRWASKSESHMRNCLVVLVTNDALDLHESLRSPSANSRVHAFPLPDLEERLAFITHALADTGTSVALSLQALANLTGGLSLARIDSILRSAAQQGLPVSADVVKAEKGRVISQQASGLVQVLEPRFGLDTLGGMEKVKAFFQEIIDAIVSGEVRLVPLGVALIGPPGTGKTALAEALAHECGFAFVKIVNPRDKWVGQSERNFAKALEIIRALAPAVVLEDEADQSEASRDDPSGDSGVTNRLRQMRFTFTSDSILRGKVLWVKITNRPDKLDAADKRSGRSSERIPLLMPDAREKESIFAVMPVKHGFDCAVDDFGAIAEACDRIHGQCISGADIEEISLRAFRRARRRGRVLVDETDYLWAIEDFIPTCDEENIRAQEMLAVQSCSSRALVPERYAKALAPDRGCEEDRS